MSNVDIKKEILEMPEKIKYMELQIAETMDDIEKINSALEIMRLNVRAAVASEKEDGKNKYPNETLREAEVMRRLQMASEGVYPEMENKLRTWKESLEVRQIELRFRINTFSALKAVAQMREG